MTSITTVVIEIPADELLSAIWYSDGSGARIGIPIDTTPGRWRIASIATSGDRPEMVRVVLAPVEPVAGGTDTDQDLERCPDMFGDARCRRRAGHLGMHEGPEAP